jgi:hypothetical protein
MPDLSDNSGRFPGYDVLSKQQGVSWNDKTRRVIAERLSLGPQPKFFTADEFMTVLALADRIVPQSDARPAIPVAVLVDHKMHIARSDGYRQPGTPREREAWRIGLKALDAEAESAYRVRFHALSASDQDALLARMQKGELQNPAWGDMAPQTFFKKRLARDLVLAYYAHPIAWSEIGWGGPASPRGYVRMDYDERDPWEAAEAKDGNIRAARWKNRLVR